MSEKRKLSERVQWVELVKNQKWLAVHDGVGCELSRWHRRGEWQVVGLAFGRSWIIKARSLADAKRLALRKMQAAICEVAEAWKD